MIGTEADARAFVAKLCTETSFEALERYCDLLIEENAQQNLVSKSSLECIWQRHIADSAQLLGYVPRETSSWLDLGTGAGLPGLVIAIMQPERLVILVESRRRRIEWLESCKAELGLHNCVIEGRRLETVDSLEAGVISARAFAPLPKLLDLSARFSTSGTYWVLPKGRSAQQEWEALKPKRRKMFHVEQSVTDPEANILVGKGRIAG